MVLSGVFDPGEFHQLPIHVAHILELVNKFSLHIAYLPFKLPFFFIVLCGRQVCLWAPQ